MTAYLTSSEFATLTVMPASYVSEIEALEAGWVDAQLAAWSAWIDSRLAKRYATPFAAPYPIAVRLWLARIVTRRCYLKRGVDPTDAESREIADDAIVAAAEIKEAADSKEGLFELPLRSDTTAIGITKTGPMTYSEASPYAGLDMQRLQAADDDQNGRGS